MSAETAGRAAWPPPPDVASIQELVRAADPEGHLAEQACADEYEPEEEAIFSVLKDLPTAELTVALILPRLEAIWQRSFQHDESAMSRVRPALLSLARQIERFFGPEARPRTRAEMLASEGPASEIVASEDPAGDA